MIQSQSLESNLPAPPKKNYITVSDFSYQKKKKTAADPEHEPWTTACVPYRRLPYRITVTAHQTPPNNVVSIPCKETPFSAHPHTSQSFMQCVRLAILKYDRISLSLSRSAVVYRRFSCISPAAVLGGQWLVGVVCTQSSERPRAPTLL